MMTDRGNKAQMNAIATPQNTSIAHQDDALSLFMKGLRITPSSHTIVMDNPRTRGQKCCIANKPTKSKGKGSTRWQATEDSLLSGLKTMNGHSSNHYCQPQKKLQRKRLKKGVVGVAAAEQERSTPSRSSSFDACSVSHQTARHRRGGVSRSYSDCLQKTIQVTNQPPALPRRRSSKDFMDNNNNTILLALDDQAPKMAVRKASNKNAPIPTRSSKSPTRNRNPKSSLSPTRSNFRVMVS